MASSFQPSDRHGASFVLKTKWSTAGTPLTYLSSAEPLPPFKRPEVQAGELFSRLPISIFTRIVLYLPNASFSAFALTSHATNFLLQPMLKVRRLISLVMVRDVGALRNVPALVRDIKVLIELWHLEKGVAETFSSYLRQPFSTREFMDRLRIFHSIISQSTSSHLD
ncbi:hypothetical protein EJ06DRAFT_35520 [Trichodelitschia bisporula]|uniref:F-box domain-containing protein n=1 Tax=Trichodelitschia bisporula TaxID=703511 RepID=A0A6G1HUW3_9PEZI|nr:hypothetical protein EJ06DRAFT_35520 [Trichodelitschia bisporula]